MTDAIVRKIRKFTPPGILARLPQKILVKKVTSQYSRIINREYLNKDKPANILSFRYGKPGSNTSTVPPKVGQKRSSRSLLPGKDYGEILVCPAIIRQEARAQGNSSVYQMTWMILHGMLHLSGLHHERSVRAARRFDALENAILSKIFKNTRN